MLNIALPKGRLGEKVYAMFEQDVLARHADVGRTALDVDRHI